MIGTLFGRSLQNALRRSAARMFLVTREPGDLSRLIGNGIESQIVADDRFVFRLRLAIH